MQYEFYKDLNTLILFTCNIYGYMYRFSFIDISLFFC